MPTQPIFTCATCDVQIGHHPTFHLGLAFCCAGCAADGPCMCSYDAVVEPVAAVRDPPCLAAPASSHPSPFRAAPSRALQHADGRRRVDDRPSWTCDADGRVTAVAIVTAEAPAPPKVSSGRHVRRRPPSAGRSPSRLAVALALIEKGVRGRPRRAVRAAGAVVDAARARAILGELGSLGLVRIARHNGDDRFYVLTSLGRHVLGGSLGADGRVVERLAELERLRTDLLSTIAHELRTPLTAIRTCVGVLRDPETTPSSAEVDTLLGTVERNADRMQRVVGDILEIARFRTGQIVLQLRRFDATTMARGAVASVAPLAAQRDQVIRLDAPSAPVRVFGDHRRLEQALVNLISNAVKYGPEGGTIAVRVRPAGRSVAWTVTDQGPGIPLDEQPHLFERFFVGQNDRDGGGRGVGLGLPTALAIAQAHGGSIDVASAPGYGSVFSVVVPAEGPPDVE
jgi:signal transduction histidine kinase